MIPVATLPVGTEYKLLKISLGDEVNDTLRIVHREEAVLPEAPVKNIKPRQLIAGMAFRLFGFDALPVYRANTGFMQRANYPDNHLTEISLNGQPNIISHATQLLRAFAQNNEVAEHGMMYKNPVADYVCELKTDGDDEDVICFSKVLGDKEIVIVYNTSETEAKEKFVLLDSGINTKIKNLHTVYGYESCGHMHIFHGKQNGSGISYLKIYLNPMHLVIFKNY